MNAACLRKWQPSACKSIRIFFAVSAFSLCRFLIARSMVIEVHFFSGKMTALKTIFHRSGISTDTITSDSFEARQVVYLRFRTLPAFQGKMYVGATREGILSREQSRYRKYLQVCNNKVVMAKPSIRFWKHFDCFFQYSCAPLCIGVAEQQLLPTEATHIQIIQPKLNYPFISKFFTPSKGTLCRSNAGSSINIGVSSVWKKHRRCRLQWKLNTVFHIPQLSSKLNIRQLICDLASERRFQAEKVIRGRDFTWAARCLLWRVSRNLAEPLNSFAISAIRRAMVFAGDILPRPAGPLQSPFLADFMGCKAYNSI